jgi:hypothetical protein
VVSYGPSPQAGDGYTGGSFNSRLAVLFRAGPPYGFHFGFPGNKNGFSYRFGCYRLFRGSGTRTLAFLLRLSVGASLAHWFDIGGWPVNVVLLG